MVFNLFCSQGPIIPDRPVNEQTGSTRAVAQAMNLPETVSLWERLPGVRFAVFQNGVRWLLIPVPVPAQENAF